jgi:hypothetical protein
MMRWWLTTVVLLLPGLGFAQVAGDDDGNSDMRSRLEGALAAFRKGDYQSAEPVFRRLADPPDEFNPVAEEARFFQAECSWRQRQFPQAARLYVKALEEYPFGRLRQHSIERLFDLANYWLDDTREEISQRQSGGWSVPLASVWNWDSSKPLLAQESEALHLLGVVQFSDPTGPRADRALFLMGSVHFFRRNYPEADRCFSQLYSDHAESKLAPLALVRAVVARRRCLEGVPADWPKLGELARLVIGGLLDNRCVDEEDRQLLCRQLPWMLWRTGRGLVPGCLRGISVPLVERLVPEFAPGSTHRRTFLVQGSAATPMIEWSVRLPVCLAATCCPAQATVRLLVEGLARASTEGEHP